jgi:outer membrane protein assembly factor BamB
MRIGSIATLLALASPSLADDWPQWRGPTFNGSTSETGLPQTWSTTENVAWVAALPGGGGSTPGVAGDRVLVTATDPKTAETFAVCLGRGDGKVRWQHAVCKSFAGRSGNTAATPSPIADGSRSYFLFGTGDFVAYDEAGKELWRRNLTKDHGAWEYMWEFGSSPVLYGGRLYLAVMHGDHRKAAAPESYLLCMDPNTGKDVWKRPRPSDAKSESRQAYTTPVPVAAAAGPMLLVVGADYLTAHRPADGEELWRSDPYTDRGPWLRTVPSAVATKDVAVVCGPKAGEMFAVPTGGKGKLTKADRLWTSKEHSPDVCTPLVYEGKLFVLDGNKKTLVCMDPATGKVPWKGDLGGKAVFQASPTGADGRVFCINLAGEVVVASAGGEFRVLHRAEMGGKACRASIAASGGQLFVRVDEKLYCIGVRAGK